jgi:hypothetical protein
MIVSGLNASGDYWNTLGGKGTWESDGCVKELCFSFDDAHAAFSKPTPSGAVAENDRGINI